MKKLLPAVLFMVLITACGKAVDPAQEWAEDKAALDQIAVDYLAADTAQTAVDHYSEFRSQVEHVLSEAYSADREHPALSYQNETFFIRVVDEAGAYRLLEAGLHRPGEGAGNLLLLQWLPEGEQQGASQIFKMRVHCTEYEELVRATLEASGSNVTVRFLSVHTVGDESEPGVSFTTLAVNTDRDSLTALCNCPRENMGNITPGTYDWGRIEEVGQDYLHPTIVDDVIFYLNDYPLPQWAYNGDGELFTPVGQLAWHDPFAGTKGLVTRSLIAGRNYHLENNTVYFTDYDDGQFYSIGLHGQNRQAYPEAGIVLDFMMEDGVVYYTDYSDRVIKSFDVATGEALPLSWPLFWGTVLWVGEDEIIASADYNIDGEPGSGIFRLSKDGTGYRVESIAEGSPLPVFPVPPLTAEEQERARLEAAMTEDFFRDRVDGSTATIPMSYALYHHFTGDRSEDPAFDRYIIEHSKTFPAYQQLLAGKAEIIFVTEPSADAQALFDSAGVDMEIIPIVKDAFILFTNAENPVTGLTAEQLRDIYTGRVTSWSQVGGEDLEIIPYQRGETSGSQTLFRSLLMGEAEPMLPPTSYVLADMGGIIDAVSEYENRRAAIGFSVFYYATEMYGNDNIRLLAVDGVAPTEENIMTGAYPFVSYYYAVIRKDLPADAPARRLIPFLLSREGQRLLQSAGYVPLEPLGEPVPGDYEYRSYYENPERRDYIDDTLYNLPRTSSAGILYSQPYCASEPVNAILVDFYEAALADPALEEKYAANIAEYGIPFSQHTYSWNGLLTSVIYGPESRISFHHYVAVPIYHSICIQLETGALVQPDRLVEELSSLEYLKEYDSIFQALSNSSFMSAAVGAWGEPTSHLPSADHQVTAAWVHSEQEVGILLEDGGERYYYFFPTNDFGSLAGG